MSSILIPRQKLYVQKYRPKWQTRKEFSGWLKPHPKDAQKAICSICNVVTKAHLCDIRKHGESKKHNSAVSLLKTLGDYNVKEEFKYDDCTGDEDDIEEDSDSDTCDTSKWSAESIDCLLVYLDIYWIDYKNDYRKKKDIWADISTKMTCNGFKVDHDGCRKKFQNIKRKYYDILYNIKVLGNPRPSHAHYFEQMDKLLGNEPETLTYLEQKKVEFDQKSTVTHVDFDEDGKILSSSSFEIVEDDHKWTDAATISFLDLIFVCKDFIKLKNGKIDNALWESVSHQMSVVGHFVGEDECSERWKNLFDQYQHYKNLSEETGSLPHWPFYMKVHRLIEVLNLGALEFSQPHKKKGKIEPSISSLIKLEKTRALSHRASNKAFDNSYDDLKERLSQLEDKSSMYRRLFDLEEKVDSLSNQTELSRTTNSLLTEILKELATVSNNFASSEGFNFVMPHQDQS